MRDGTQSTSKRSLGGGVRKRGTVRIDFRWVVELSTPVLYTTVASLDPVPRLGEKKKHDLVV